jgi:hypothetical protein
MPERTSSSELDAGTVEGRAELRRLAAAAREQLAAGPAEWPGRPSRQRLELFMATGPEVVLHLLDHYREEEE